VKIGKYMHNFT